MRMRYARTWAGLGLALTLVTAAARPTGAQQRQPASAEWAARWRADLRTVAESLPAFHADLYHTVSRERFHAALDSLAARVPTLAHHEIVVELARIVALVRDGHTRLTLPFDAAAGFFTGHRRTPPPRIPGLVLRHYPIRLGLFADGAFVIRSDAAHRDLLGRRVLKIGDMTVEQALDAVEPTMHRDNTQQVRHLAPTWLVVPEILHARGVVADMQHARLVVAEGTGGQREVALAPLAPGTDVRWVDVRDGVEPPLYEMRPERRHWFTDLPGSRTVYARYREVQDDGGQTVAEYAERLFAHVARRGADRLIVDVRGNPGGNGDLNRPLLLGAIRAERLWKPGGLIVLMDRGTFSAALMFAADFETFTPALFVGETTGGAPNHFGDSRRLRLPETGLTIRASTRYWQMTHPLDGRDGVTPHLTVEPRFADYRAGRDPVLDTALALGRYGGDPEGVWVGVLSYWYQRLEITLRIARDGEGWSVRLDVPAAGVARAPLQEGAFEDGELGGTWVTDAGPWRFAVRPAGDRMVGVARFRGWTVPLLLRRRLSSR